MALNELRLLGFLLGLVAGGVLSLALLESLPRFGFERTNFAGGKINTAGGLVFVLVGLCALPSVASMTDPAMAPLCPAIVGFGMLGLLDDRWGTAEFKGLRGHLRALCAGRVTTGFVKAVGGLALAVLIAAWITRGWETVPAALLIALSANLFNLLDLRPLRALKAFWAFGFALGLVSSWLLAVLLGTSIPYAVQEARRRLMLGDTGSNALGGVIGVAAAVALPAWAQVALVALLAAFHLWAEQHSLTAWIEAHPWARAVDGWGWRSFEKPLE